MEAEGDRGRAERSRFAMGIVTSALAPTNTLLGNPAALKKTLEAGGATWCPVRGTSPRRAPQRRDAVHGKAGGLEVGRTWRSPGQVAGVERRCSEHPPPGTRPRASDAGGPAAHRQVLLPGPQAGTRFVEHSVGSGLQTFLLSWRNPGPDQSEWDMDTYAERILSAIDAVREVTGSDDVNVIGFCAGGILNTAVLNHLASRGDQRIHSASYAVTLLDFGQSSPIGAFSSARLLSLARWKSSRAGVISARSMGNVFTWMRPNDLVWNYWVNNYLMGQDPPVFDILAWNADGTNLPSVCTGSSSTSSSTTRCPTRAPYGAGDSGRAGAITVPNYVIGAVTDHLTPWKSCYLTTQLLGGDSTFALSSVGPRRQPRQPSGQPQVQLLHRPSRRSGGTRRVARARRQTHRIVVGALGRVGRRTVGREVPASDELGPVNIRCWAPRRAATCSSPVEGRVPSGRRWQ